MENSISGETASESYLTEGFTSQTDMVVGMTLNCVTCCTDLVRENTVPVANEFGIKDTSDNEYSVKTECTRDHDKVSCHVTEEHASNRQSLLPNGYPVVGFNKEFLPSAISTEVDLKAISANFRGESFLPPSPIIGVIDCCVSRSKRDISQLGLLSEEEPPFSFQPPKRILISEKSKNGFQLQGIFGKSSEPEIQSPKLLVEQSADVISSLIHEDTLIIKEKEISTSLPCSATFENDQLSVEENKAPDFISMPPQLSFKYGNTKRKKLLVLDLNGLLADIVNDYHFSCGVQMRVGGKPFFKRPFCDEFLKFCFENFDIGIWSSRRRHNVDCVVEYLLRDYKHKLLFCWDQSKCTYTGAKTIENHHKPLVLKELKKLWDKEDSELPWEKGEYSPSNTLLLDDSPYKAICNPPYTAIFPYPYHYQDEGDTSLGPGGDIRVYLEQLVVANDVQHYVKEHPFGQPAITASDRHWDFYCQIIEKHTSLPS